MARLGEVLGIQSGVAVLSCGVCCSSRLLTFWLGRGFPTIPLDPVYPDTEVVAYSASNSEPVVVTDMYPIPRGVEEVRIIVGGT